MSIIHKYIIKEIFRILFIILSLLTCLFIINDFIGKISELNSKGISLLKGLYYVIFRVPFFVATILPVSTVLSVLVVFCLMYKRNELTAIEGAGISRMYIYTAPFLTGIVLSIILFITAEIAAPAALIEADKIIPTYKKITYNWLKSSNSITHVRYYEKEIKKISGLSIYYFDKNFRLTKRIDAKTCRYNEKNKKWELNDLITQQIRNKEESVVNHINRKTMGLHFKPENLGNIIRKRRAISSKDLKEIIDKMESEGYDAVGYKVDYYNKLAMPFVCFLMTLIAVLFSSYKKIIKRMPLAILCGIVIWFLHWVIHSLFLSLGKGELISPIVSAWLSNGLFFAVTVFVLSRRNKAV